MGKFYFQSMVILMYYIFYNFSCFLVCLEVHVCLCHLLLKSPCCNKIYTCRLCHDESEKHEIDRHAVMSVVCQMCNTRQSVSIYCMWITFWWNKVFILLFKVASMTFKFIIKVTYLSDNFCLQCCIVYVQQLKLGYNLFVVWWLLLNVMRQSSCILVSVECC